MAGKSGLSRGTIQKIETDKTQRNQGRIVRALATAFSISLERLEECVRSEDIVGLEVPAEVAAKIRTAAEEAGMSVADFLAVAVASLKPKRPSARRIKKNNVHSVRTSEGERKQSLGPEPGE